MHRHLRFTLVATLLSLAACGTPANPDGGGDARVDARADGQIDGALDGAIDVFDARLGEVATDTIPVDTGSDAMTDATDGGDASEAGACTDNDLDGYGDGPGCMGADCNDNDANVHPSAFEICNNEDDDCDGTVDNGLGQTSCGVGVCMRTVDNCAAGVVQQCTPGMTASETCNGIDDDCNGMTDEAIADIHCGVGACAVTVPGCTAGAVPTCTPRAPVAETCNGIDDDCDGTIDNGFGAVTCGMGACTRTVSSCSGGTSGMCTPGTAVAETCDGIDNDCDGTVDDGLGSSPCGVGACARTAPNCVSGRPNTCVPGTPANEVCNGIDDNCNGVVDEGFGTTSCGTGACARTVDICSGGMLRSCVAGTPVAETCNGIDDNCNGTTDEGLGAITCGTGACMRTVNRCVGGVTQTCTPAAAGTETCNGIDDDCDGVVDDGLGSTTCGAGACVRTVPNCIAGVPNTCTPTGSMPETCNGIDDDCDGMIDEMLTQSCYTGAPGTVGVGTCRAGTQTCAAGAWGACAGQVVPAAETCNGSDDNCNGTTDEGITRSCYSGAAGTSGVGACRSGTQTCSAGAFGTCVGQVVPATETCNNVDDDCDGMTDETITQSCYSGPAGTSGVGPCRTGTQTCTAGAFGTCAGQVVPATETCNNVDDNCNGSVDESVTRSCYTGAAGTSGVGACRAGTQTCTAGTFSATCAGQVVPATEACNNVDDDCDGMVDETLTQSCYTGAAGTQGVGVCRAGTQTCNAGSYSSCAGQVVPATEACNGLDDDCNGMVDNGLGSTTCGTGACQRTVQNCVGGATQSCTPLAGSAETCNGIDDNCDGFIDNGVTQSCYTGPAGTAGVGACRAGTQTCSGGAFGACGGQVVPVAEVCGNGVDDDCNGVQDNGCAPANDVRASAVNLAVGAGETSVMGTTRFATHDGPAVPCACTSGGDVWYTFTIAATSVVYLDTAGSAANTAMLIADSAGAAIPAQAGNGQPNAGVCNDDSGCPVGGGWGSTQESRTWAYLNPGQYYVAISSCTSSAFTLHLQVLPTTIGSFFYSTRFTGDTTTATVLVGTSAQTGICGGTASGEDTRWFTTCGVSTQFFSLCNSDGGNWQRRVNATSTPIWDPSMYIRSAQTGLEVTCNDDGGAADCRGYIGSTPTTTYDTAQYGSRISTAVPRGLNAVFVDERVGGSGMNYSLRYTVRD